MMGIKRFELVILEEAFEFISEQDLKTRQKIFEVLNRSRFQQNSIFFKKLNNNIWEFRILYKKKKIRILAFWDKSDKQNTLVLASNGFTKQKSKTPKTEIEKAEKIMTDYFNEKNTDEKI